MKKEYKVTIVVPCYKQELSEYERISFDRLCETLGNHRIIVIKPRSLRLPDSITGNNRVAGVECFADSYFAGRIAGYNRLMMSKEFYSRFENSEYILIYQLDAYVFRDELESWCDKGYDYIGAPWLLRPVYEFPLLRFISWLKRKFCDLTGRPNGQITRYKVGNGGLSLRWVDSHLKAVEKLNDVIESFVNAEKHHHTFNEDVFFGVWVNRYGMNFRYPDWKEALKFSFDKYPGLCYELNGNNLPFGCHSWYGRKMRKFWFPIILQSKKTLSDNGK